MRRPPISPARRFQRTMANIANDMARFGHVKYRHAFSAYERNDARRARRHARKERQRQRRK